MPRKGILASLIEFLAANSITIATFLVLFAGWEATVRAFNINPVLLPSPSETVGVMLNLQRGYFVPWDVHIGATLFEILAGFGLASIVGILLAMLIVYSFVLERVLLPLIVFIEVLPKIAVAPLLLIWIGYGTGPKVGIAFLIAFFPIAVSAAAGLREVETDMIDLMRILRATKLQIFFKVRFPNAVPHIMSGLSIGMASAVIGAIVGEFVAADVGLGFLIVNAQYQLQTPMAFAALFYIAIIGLVLYGAVIAAGKLIRRV